MKFQLKKDDLNIHLTKLSKKRTEIRIALKEVGYPKCRRRPITFESLAHIVIGQQVSTKAALSIFPSKPIFKTPAAEHIAAPKPIKAIGVALLIKLRKREISKISNHSII